MSLAKKNKKQIGGNFGEHAYKSSVHLGRFSNWLTLIGGIVVSVITALFGWLVLYLRKQDWKAITGRVASVNCRERNVTVNSSQGKSRVDTRLECDVKVEYEFQNEVYTTVLKEKERATEGEDVKILVDPDNPQNAQKDHRAVKTGSGWGLIALAILILFGAGVRFYIVRNSELAAAASGAATAWNFVT